MSLINLIILLVVIGLVLYLVNTYIPMDAKIKGILNVVVIVVVCLWLLQVLVGPLTGLSDVRVGP